VYHQKALTICYSFKIPSKSFNNSTQSAGWGTSRGGRKLLRYFGSALEAQGKSNKDFESYKKALTIWKKCWVRDIPRWKWTIMLTEALCKLKESALEAYQKSFNNSTESAGWGTSWCGQKLSQYWNGLKRPRKIQWGFSILPNSLEDLDKNAWWSASQMRNILKGG